MTPTATNPPTQRRARPATSRAPKPLAWLEPAVVCGSCVPFAWLLLRGVRGDLGANPIEASLNQLGKLALVFFLASFACSPLRIALGWTWQMRLRRPLGIFAFLAALTHFVVYAALDQALQLRAIFADVVKRPFIAVGFAALVLLTPLGLTSFKSSPKTLGFKRWKRLHLLVFPAAALACVHFYLRVKAAKTEPLVYAGLFALLLLTRAFDVARGALTKRKRAATATE